MNENFPLQSISKSPQPHRFFERKLDNNLDELIEQLQNRYEKIKNATLPGITPLKDGEIWQESGSVSTMKWREYNVFQFHIPAVYELYRAVGSMVREACDYYEIDFEEQKFMIQGWFNINHAKTGKLGWHEHGPTGAPNFHGYYAVKAEPSQTHYITNMGPKINENRDNVAILSEMGHPHAQGDWTWDGPRITIAYDVQPLQKLINGTMGNAEQHWLPLA